MQIKRAGSSSSSISGQIHERGSVILFPLHVFVLNEVLNLIFEHLWISLEHRDVPHDVGLEVLIAVRLLGLHDLYTMRLNDESTLPIHSFYCFSLLGGHAGFLLLY